MYRKFPNCLFNRSAFRDSKARTVKRLPLSTKGSAVQEQITINFMGSICISPLLSYLPAGFSLCPDPPDPIPPDIPFSVSVLSPSRSLKNAKPPFSFRIDDASSHWIFRRYPAGFPRILPSPGEALSVSNPLPPSAYRPGLAVGRTQHSCVALIKLVIIPILRRQLGHICAVLLECCRISASFFPAAAPHFPWRRTTVLHSSAAVSTSCPRRGMSTRYRHSICDDTSIVHPSIIFKWYFQNSNRSP